MEGGGWGGIKCGECNTESRSFPPTRPYHKMQPGPGQGPAKGQAKGQPGPGPAMARPRARPMASYGKAKGQPGARPRAIHGYGPCPATNEHCTRAMDMISSQIKALSELFISR